MTTTGDRYRVGFDIGGTFTDFVLVDGESGQVHLHKCLTTPDDPSEGALEGLKELVDGAGISLADVGHLIHGTTLVTNALIERRGAKLALITTRGFRDTLEMGTEQRYDIHDLFLLFPEPLVPRSLRREVNERINRDGDVVAPLNLNEVRREARNLAAQGIEAIAVCFLHAYQNPVHEQAVKALLNKEFPQFVVSISSEVQPELREYERVSTTAANAYVQPLTGSYVRSLTENVAAQGFTGKFHLMQSSGGLAAPGVASEFPIRFLESGPAGGGTATAYFGAQIGQSDVISFDMGGTTAKACLVEDGRVDVAPMMEAARVHRFKRGSGLPVKAPVIDMIEIGAGGGSIARVDDLGLLKVGPGSAGAAPGPACYGQGGTEATVTDANLLLGYLDPGFFLGGRMNLDMDSAAGAMQRLAERLGLGAEEAAWGVYEIVCENMAGAARVHIVEKGHDPRRYAMVAMGGAGPAHAARVARKLGVKEVLIPPASGAASALGFLVAPASFESVRSLPGRLDALDFTAVNRLLEELETEGRRFLDQAGIPEDQVEIRRAADMRLMGQMHEISVPLPELALGGGNLEQVRHAFVDVYTQLYTHLYEGAEIQVLNWRVVCSGPTPHVDVTQQVGGTATGEARKGSRMAYFADSGGAVETPVFDRYALAPGDRLEGPAIVEEREATTILPPGDTLTVDDHFNLRVTVHHSAALDVVVPEGMEVAEAAARIESDPVGLEIMWSRLINITEECWSTVIRTAFSLIIGEAQDFACELLDAKGKQLAHSPRAMPVFNLTLPRAIAAMLEKYPAETLKPGDVLITNDPWRLAGHLFDVLIAVPSFYKGRMVAVTGIVGHVADIGGTTDSMNAREIYEEGIQIPPLKFYKEGVLNQDVVDLIAENVRLSDQVLGDLHALVSAGRLGAERVVEFMDDYGLRDLEALAMVVQGRAEKAMRDAIREVPDGVYTGEIWNDALGDPECFPVRITVADDEIDVDYAGTPPQHPRGASNSTLNYAQAHTAYPLKCMLTPDVPGNAGCYRPFRMTAPEGSILNCTRPAAVNSRVRSGWYLAPNIFNTLAEAMPDKVKAFTGLPNSGRYYGYDAQNKLYNDHLFQGGGQGASTHHDGKSGLLWPTSAANTSVEMFEARVPVLVMSKSYETDSGGAGRNRGGLGQQLRTRKLYEDGLPTHVFLYPNNVLVDQPGLFGGQSGKRSHAGVTNEKGEMLTDVGVGALVSLHAPDQIAEFTIGGGSGYGEPTERPIELVQSDLDNGYISAQAAQAVYGCVVGADGRIDEAATEERRRERASSLVPAQ